MEDNSIIKALCSGLPNDIRNVIYNEFDYRQKEIQRIWSHDNNKYSKLRHHQSVVFSILAMSIYYKQVISVFWGTCNFFNRVDNLNLSKETVIQIGAYKLDKETTKKLYYVFSSFNNLMSKYNIEKYIFQYSDTIGFLRNIFDFYVGKESMNNENNYNGDEEDDPF